MRSEQFHLIGHSLGAHASGNAGEKYQYLMNGTKVARITGLDPAQPLFRSDIAGIKMDKSLLAKLNKLRLDPTDAEFVDVIHTDTIHMINMPALKGFGLFEPCGHKDFYPNGGWNQPGCDKRNRITRGLVHIRACHHDRALDFFTESIETKCVFWSRQCENWDKFKTGKCSSTKREKMGYYATPPKKPSTRMTLYLKTLSKYPFCWGDMGANSKSLTWQEKFVIGWWDFVDTLGKKV